MSWNRYGWRPYVSVAQRRAQAQRKMDALRKRGVDVHPVKVEGRKITRTFWGDAWCDHLKSFSDYANRLPRGRTYVRNGSVCHLEINKGEVLAKVAGTELYDVCIRIQPLPTKTWNAIKGRCVGQVGSLLELLQGKLSDHVMSVVTDRTEGLFPKPPEISLNCDCPDWADMCKHAAAVLYGVGARLDRTPELLFTLRGVDHEELIAADAEGAVSAATSRSSSKRLADGELSDVFGIDLDTSDESGIASPPRKRSSRGTKSVPPGKKAKKKKTVAKNPPRKTKKKLARKTSKKKTARKTAAKKSATKKRVPRSTKPTKKKKAPKKEARAARMARKPR